MNFILWVINQPDDRQVDMTTNHGDTIDFDSQIHDYKCGCLMVQYGIDLFKTNHISCTWTRIQVDRTEELLYVLNIEEQKFVKQCSKAEVKTFGEAKKLIKPSTLLSRPENWTQGWFAKTSKGSLVNSHDPTATCFCLIGALTKLNSPPEVVTKIKDKVGPLDWFNDKTDHQTLLETLKGLDL